MPRQSLKEHAGPIALALVIGMLAGLGAVLFRWAIHQGQELLWPMAATFTDQVRRAPGWWVMLAPAGIGLLLGPLLCRYAPEVRGPGVPEVMEALALRGGRIRHRVTLFKSLATAGFIAAGASVGREGPIVQIGASIGSSLTQLLGLRRENRRLAVACGAAAGIAATFQAPMAGALFAVEILLADLEIKSLSTIFIASVTGTVTARSLLGQTVVFTAPAFPQAHPAEFLLYALLGLLAGLAGLLLMWSIFRLPKLWKRLGLPDWLTPAAGGLLVGGLGLAVPDCLGVGYEGINTALAGQIPLTLAAILLTAKLAATGLCIGSGMSGGIFAPSLFLGAMLGSLMAQAAGVVWPTAGLVPAHYALIGMGAMVSGTTLAPITAVLTIFELTYSYQVIVPLLVACIVSLLTVRILHGYSIYETKLLHKGLDIVKGHEVNVLRGMRVGDHMDRNPQLLAAATPCPEIMARMEESPFPHFIVVDEQRRLAGVLTLRDFRHILAHPDRCRPETMAVDLMRTKVITVSEENDLAEAFHRFAAHEFASLPVVAVGDPTRVVGQLKKSDMLAAYEQFVFKEHILSPLGWVCPLPGTRQDRR